jgi:radical SAM superfamily enzyme
VDLVVSCIGALSPDIVIHRLTGDGPSNQLISPLWSRAKRSVLNCIHHELKTRGIYQGCFLKEQG